MGVREKPGVCPQMEGPTLQYILLRLPLVPGRLPKTAFGAASAFGCLASLDPH